MPLPSSTPAPDQLFYLRASKRRKTQLRQALIVLAIALVTYWAAVGTETSIGRFIDGLYYGYDFLTRSLPPSFEEADRILPRLFETLAIALLGTTFGILLAFPLAIFASRNIVKNPLIYQSVRFVIDTFRGISEIVWAYLLV